MVIVTGGTGMLGANILHGLMKEGFEVLALKRQSSSLARCKSVFEFFSDVALFEQIKWADCDITDSACLDSYINADDVVVHAAAMVSFGRNAKQRIYDVNSRAVGDIVNICLAKKVRKLCYISSIASLSSGSYESETGERFGEIEDDVSDYSKSKYLGELEVWRGVHEGLNAVILNPSVIIGVGGDASGSGAFFERALSGNRFYTSGGTGFVDAYDVVKAVLIAIKSDVSAERFVLNGENLSYKVLFDLLAKYLDAKQPDIKVGVGVLRFVSLLEKVVSWFTRKTPQLTKQVIRSSQVFSKYSNAKACDELNMEFTRIKDTIKNYTPYYISERKGLG